MATNPFATGGAAPQGGASPFSTSTTTAPAGANGSAQPQGSAAAAGVPDAPQELIDLDSPLLTSEQLVNTEGDAYAQPAPPPDGKWRAKLKLQGLKHDGSEAAKKLWPGKAEKDIVPYLVKTHKNKAGQVDQVYLYTGIEARIIDPSGKFDDLPLFDSWVGTFQGRDGSTKVATILRLLKQPNGQPYVESKAGTAPGAAVKAGQSLKQQEWMELFVKALAGEPEIGLESQWEWSCEGCGQEAKAQGKAYPKSITGMQKFPASKTVRGAFDPEMPCQVNKAHAYSRARATIARFIGLEDLR